MSADWEEVKRLAADFQRAQLSSTVQRLSERNCIEIVKKLLELKLIDVIFTNDGKEYLTHPRLIKEIKDELIVHGGRINLVDLAQIIGVDFNYVEAKSKDIVRHEVDVQLVLGQLITNDYLDSLAEEINEKLNQVGELSIAQLTKIYDLPGDFLEQVLHQRLGTIIQGQVDPNDSRTFFTQSYLAQNTARIQGVLSAVTRPVPVTTLKSHYKFPEKLFHSVTEDLLKNGRLAGNLLGGSERAIYLPNIYAECQNEYIDSFFRQNGYLEYEALERLGVQDPLTYIRKKFKDETVTNLKTVCVGKNILIQVEGTIEEALNSGTWVDVMTGVPSVFTCEDCKGVINAVSKSLSMSKEKSVLHVYCDTIILSDELLKSCYEYFDPIMTTKAQEDIIKNPHCFVEPQQMKSNVSKKDAPQKGKQDRKEERKSKRQSGGKSGGGTQGRETKMKAVKKKYYTGKDVEESGSEDDSISSPKDVGVDLPFLTTEEIEKHLNSLETINDAPEQFISELAQEMHRPLMRKYQEVAKTLYTSSVASSGPNRRKLHAEFQEKFSSLLNHIAMFERGAKLFPDDVSSQLCKHLLKTLCSDLTNMIINYLGTECGVIPSGDGDKILTPDLRLKLINKFAEELKEPLVKLHSSLNEKNSEEFQSSVVDILGHRVCDMTVKKLDKKKERLILANQRQSLLVQLTDATDPALCLHLAVLLIFQGHTHNMLHASGKFVPQIISYLQRQVPSDTYQLLSSYQELVMKKLSDEEEDHECVLALTEAMPRVKEAAVTYKKTPISETDKSES